AATVIILAVSAVVAVASRQLSGGLGYLLAKSVTAGYSIPGAIIAIGVLSVFIMLDQWLAPFYVSLGIGKGEAPLVLSLSVSMLIAAYVVRFMATGFNALEAGYERIS